LSSSSALPLAAAAADTHNYTLADGTVIQVTGALAENSPVQVVTAQGTSPIPDGTYTLRDDAGKETSITTVGGMITKTEDAAQPDDTAAVQARELAFRESQDRISKLEAENRATRQSFTRLVELVDLLVNQPAKHAAEPPLNPGLALRKSRPNPLEIVKLLKDNK
jgi:hypothetical protein